MLGKVLLKPLTGCTESSENYTAKNAVTSPDFVVWKFCGKAQFPHSFGRFARNSAETLPFSKISKPENQVKL